MENPRFLTTKEFAELCSTKDSKLKMPTLYSDIRRNKVNQKKDKTIDIEDPINAEYIKKKKYDVDLESKKAHVEVERRKKMLEMEKAEEDLRTATIKRMKLEGELIPTELVNETFRVHFKSVTKAFHNAAEQMAIDLVKKLKGKREDSSYAKGQLVLAVNDAVAKAHAISKNELETLIEEYSEKRGKGERI